MRSSKYDPRRQQRSGTLNKKIIGGLLLIAAVIFSASIISSIFSQSARRARTKKTAHQRWQIKLERRFCAERARAIGPQTRIPRFGVWPRIRLRRFLARQGTGARRHSVNR